MELGSQDISREYMYMFRVEAIVEEIEGGTRERCRSVGFARIFEGLSFWNYYAG